MGCYVFYVGDLSKLLENENLLMICVDFGGEEEEVDMWVILVIVRFNVWNVWNIIESVEV